MYQQDIGFVLSSCALSIRNLNLCSVYVKWSEKKIILQCFSLLLFIFTDKKKSSITDLLFRRSPDKRTALSRNKKGPQLQVLQGARGFRYINYQNRPPDVTENPMNSPKIRNALFCAVILEEFVKELAAYSQEQAVLAHVEV